MTALFDKLPQPWSPEARSDAAKGREALSGLVGSLAQSRLYADIVRYARGEISGRSFLLVGHRGAGKTTAMLAAMQDAYNTLVRDAHHRRLLLVRLQAPSLRVQTEVDAKETKLRPVTEPAGIARRFLQEMAAGLFPALIDEIRRLLQARMLQSQAATGRTQAYLAEMSAHICDELSRGMELAELRELFRRYGLLETGLVGNRNIFDELAAVNAASESYLVVTGRLEDEAKRDDQDRLTRELKVAQSIDSDKIVKALTPVSAAAAAALVPDRFTGALLALAILGSGLAFTWSSARFRSRSSSRIRSFKRDNSHESLLVRLPLLIEQLREVGFPPVFVLDEIDKVEDAPKLMSDLMSNLKSYVSERCFLCFIADRSYYEHITDERDGARTRYGREYTFYSDVSYVASTPSAFHQHVRLMTDEDALDGDSRVDPVFRAMLRHVILHRSRMHPFDLRRDLRAALDYGEVASVTGAAGAFRPPATWVYRSFLQLAIEWILSDSRMRRTFAEDPLVNQHYIDVLYGICEAWKQTRRPEPPTEAAKIALPAYERMLRYLESPQSLDTEILNELNLDRLEYFLLASEVRPNEGAVRDAKAEYREVKPLDRDEAWLWMCLASRKYRLLRECLREVKPMFNPGGGGLPHWAIDPHGHPPAHAGLSEVHDQRLNDVAALRARFDSTGLPFDRAWDLADRTLSYAQLEAALAQVQRTRGDDATRTLQSYAEAAPASMQFAVLFATATALVASVAKVKRERAVEALERVVQGTTAETRVRSLSRITAYWARAHYVDLPEKVTRLVDPEVPRTSTEEFAFYDLTFASPEAWRDARPVPPAREEMWMASLANRILASIGGRSLTADEEQEGAALDVMADIYGWAAPALSAVWPKWPRVNEWSIATHSEILADSVVAGTTDRPARAAPSWLRAYSAAKLGQTDYFQQLEVEAQLDPASADIRAAAEIVRLAHEHIGERLGERQLRIVLLNPGPVMGEWLPDPTVPPRSQVVAVSSRSADLPELFRSNDLILSEVIPPTAAELADARNATAKAHGVLCQCALIERGSPGVEQAASGVTTIRGPRSLQDALRLFSRPFATP